MFEFYDDIFERYVITLAESCRTFDLTDISVFKAILEVYRPLQGSDGELKILNCGVQAYRLNKAAGRFYLPFFKEDVWNHLEYLY
jgi:hypothetical protein